MINFLRKIINFLSPYSQPLEKKADRFFSKINPHTNKSAIHRKILELMQEDIVVLHIWCERRYKGYRYLNKKKRKKLYENAEKMRRSFENFCLKQKPDISKIFQHLEKKGITVPQFFGKERELKYLTCLMSYFSGGKGHFKYQESSNFGELLKDPAKEKLIGDCNQIVTLYVYFFALQYDISELQLKFYPEHVCLHYKGVDIEATNGSFQNYHEKEQKILPVTELIALNLLDVADKREEMYVVSPDSFMESSKLTFLLSSDQATASHNLKVAYQTIISRSIKEKQFDKALRYAKQSKDPQFIQLVSHNAALYFLKHNQFRRAEKFSQIAKNEKLQKAIIETEGIYYFKKKDFEKALSLFQKIHHTDLIKSCYEGIFMKLNKELQSVKTINQLKRKKTILKKMQEYAKKAQNPKMIKYVSDLLKQIKQI